MSISSPVPAQGWDRRLSRWWVTAGRSWHGGQLPTKPWSAAAGSKASEHELMQYRWPDGLGPSLKDMAQVAAAAAAHDLGAPQEPAVAWPHRTEGSICVLQRLFAAIEHLVVRGPVEVRQHRLYRERRTFPSVSPAPRPHASCDDTSPFPA
jgi:hypothetical protein